MRGSSRARTGWGGGCSRAGSGGGDRKALEEHGKGLRILADEIATEMVGKFEEKSHWVFAVKE